MSAGTFIGLAIGTWMVVIGLVLSLVRAAAGTNRSCERHADLDPAVAPVEGLICRAMPAHAAGPPPRRASGPGPTVGNERVLGLMLRTLALRDPSTGRHAAAVAHNARELALGAGLTERDQGIAHTAGLLHDIGKEAFPDSILVAERELGESDLRVIRRHPVDGARLVREVPGFESVADAVLSHHERLDGNGYPHGLRGKAIPSAARVIAVAEVYDVLTAPDSYRRPLTVEDALMELRGAAGTQLDPHLVEVFAAAVAAKGPAAFRRHGDADLETELRHQKVAHELLSAQPLLP